MLIRDGQDENVLRRPNLSDAADNSYRLRLLDEHRAYDRREGLFLDFPQRVDWFRAVLERDEVLDVLYIDWDWWLKISAGSRRPRDAARRIRAGEVPGVDAADEEPVAAALLSDAPQPELIAVTTPGLAPLVLVEGHGRLTAYALFPDYLPPVLEILLGVSNDMTRWCQF